MRRRAAAEAGARLVQADKAEQYAVFGEDDNASIWVPCGDHVASAGSVFGSE
jgi:hypothetical protein